MKTIEEIYNELKAAFEEETGVSMNDGGDMALRFRAFAAQLASLQAQAEHTQRQCFPQTASGEALDTHALQRGLYRAPATRAVGSIRFFLNAPAVSSVTVPAGTRCITAKEIEFEVSQDCVIPVGSFYCDAQAIAVKAGNSGNVAENQIVFMELAPPGVSSCTNPVAFGGGCDAEDDETLRRRVLDSFYNAPNSGNAAYYRDLALSVEGVAAATVQPRSRGRGTVDITVAGENGAAEPAVLAQVAHRLSGKREICVDVYVNNPTLSTVDVDVDISVLRGHDVDEVEDAVAAAIRAYFNGRLLGKGVKTIELGSLIFGIDGVENCIINSPAGDIEPSSSVLPVLGDLSISEA